MGLTDQKGTRMTALVSLGPHCPGGWAQTLVETHGRKETEALPCAPRAPAPSSCSRSYQSHPLSLLQLLRLREHSREVCGVDTFLLLLWLGDLHPQDSQPSQHSQPAVSLGMVPASLDGFRGSLGRCLSQAQALPARPGI